MAFEQSIYRLIGLDGRPHKVLDAPYESLEAALGAAEIWIKRQGHSNLLGDSSIGIEVLTSNGSWRTVRYQHNSAQSA